MYVQYNLQYAFFYGQKNQSCRGLRIIRPIGRNVSIAQ